MKRKRCCECWDGEIENYDVDGKIHIIKNPDTGKIVRKGYICSDHLEMLADDGYLIDGVKESKKGLIDGVNEIMSGFGL
jgi:hypothetical protein